MHRLLPLLWLGKRMLNQIELRRRLIHPKLEMEGMGEDGNGMEERLGTKPVVQEGKGGRREKGERRGPTKMQPTKLR